MGIWFDTRLDRMLSKVMRKEDVAREKAGKPNGNQIDMFDSKSNRKHDS